MDSLSKFSWVFAALGVFFLVVFGSLSFIYKEVTEAALAFAIAGGLSTGLFVWLERVRLQQGVSSRAFRYGVGATLTVLLGGGISVAAYVVARDHDHTWDLTADQRFTLSEQSIKVMSGLDQDVGVLAFFRFDSAEEQTFRGLMDRMSEHTPRLQVQYVDPLRDRLLAQQYTVTTEYGTVVLLAGDHEQRLEDDFGEEAFVNGVVKLLSGERHRVCWVEGHGEMDPEDNYTAVGAGFIKAKLEGQNYSVERIKLLPGGVDFGCEVVVMPRPTVDLLQPELDALAAYVGQGGSLVLTLEPSLLTPVPNLAADLERYGLLVGDDVILDDDPNMLAAGSDGTLLMVDLLQQGGHPITSSLKAAALFSMARTVTPVPDLDGLQADALFVTSPSAWGETNLEPGVPPQRDEGIDKVGMLSFAAVSEIGNPDVLGVPLAGEEAPVAPEAPAEGEEPSEVPATPDGPDLTALGASAPRYTAPADYAPVGGGKVIVFGDSDFLANQLVTQGNNQDVFLNAIAFGVDEEDQLAERPNEAGDQSLSLSLVQVAVLWLVSIFLVPGTAVGLGILVMVRRRFL